jgi:hypothetical protein
MAAIQMTGARINGCNQTHRRAQSCFSARHARSGAGATDDFGMRFDNATGTERLLRDDGHVSPLFDEFHDAAAKVAGMDRKGLDISVISPTPMIYFYWLDIDRRAGSVACYQRWHRSNGGAIPRASARHGHSAHAKCGCSDRGT